MPNAPGTSRCPGVLPSSSAKGRYERSRSAIALGVALLAVSACSDESALSPTTADDQEARVEVRPGPGAQAVESLARGLALALAEPNFRQQILEDLRDSPFPKNALHLPSYLASDRGSRLLAAVSQTSGRSTAQLLAGTRVAGDLELVMPRPMDRTEWRGEDDIVVQGTTLKMAQRVHARPENGYTVRGDSVAFDVFDTPGFPLLLVRPIEWTTPVDPEAERRSAPARTGASITSRDVEIARLTSPRITDPGVSSLAEDCDLRTAKVKCDDDLGPGGPYGLPLPSGRTYEQCVSPTAPAPDDYDSDAVVDSCEFELAHTFRPRLATAWDDCNLGREPYWLVQKGPSSIANSVRIFYALSYYFDCGDEEVYGHAHLGDSEFIWLDVVKYGEEWKLHGAFLSAHWHATIDESSYYTAGSFQYAGGWASRPIIWVAEDKHANYRNRSVCDAGAAYADNCTNGSPNADVEVLPTANLGNRRYPFVDVVTSRTGWDPARGVALTGFESYWTPNSFYGWYGSRAGASGMPYSEMFVWYGIGW